MGLLPEKGKESKRNGVLDFRKGKPDFKVLQAVLPRVDMCFLITEDRKKTKGRARGKMQ